MKVRKFHFLALLIAALFIGMMFHANPVQAATKPGLVKITGYGSSAGTVTIKWSKVSGASSYRVVRRVAGTTDFYTVQKDIKTTSFTDKTVKAGKKYQYRVYGVNSAGHSDHEKSTIITVTVKSGGSKTVSVTGVSLNLKSGTMRAGKSYTLKATVKPSTATNKKVTWSSSNTSVATVNASGKITAKKAGTAYITVKTADGGKTAKFKLMVSSASASSSSASSSSTSSTVSSGSKVGVSTANMSAKGAALLKQMEGTGGSKNTKYTNGKLTAIRLQDNGDGGLTIGWGVYIKYDSGRGYSSSTIKKYKSQYGINLADSDSWVKVAVCEKLFQQGVEKKEVLIRNWLKKKGIKTVKQQVFDALVIQAFNSGTEAKLAPYLKTNLSESSMVAKIMANYKERNPVLWWKYGKGWTNRVVSTVRVALQGVYKKHY